MTRVGRAKWYKENHTRVASTPAEPARAAVVRDELPTRCRAAVEVLRLETR